jgi:cytochrome c-type biogenesis protein CcmH/NrfG
LTRTITWYGDAFKLAPKDIHVGAWTSASPATTSTSGRGAGQFDTSLKLDPKHAKTLLNLGIVNAFGKQDLQGASEAWQQVIKLSPDSPEAQAARRALDSLQSAHPAMGTPQKPGA